MRAGNLNRISNKRPSGSHDMGIRSFRAIRVGIAIAEKMAVEILQFH